MDYCASQELISMWLMHYGCFALFGLLAVGIIALPVPDETLMIAAGGLLSHGNLNLHSTLVAAYAGSMCGITVSYFIGRTAGTYFLTKVGPWFGLTHTKMKKVHSWFEHFGKWTLLIGYFVPGIRHLTGVSAGIANLEYDHFALFAYLGAFLWVSTFLATGYFGVRYFL
jgi:membrane protein DedA with SNARE-associated domain